MNRLPLALLFATVFSLPAAPAGTPEGRKVCPALPKVPCRADRDVVACAVSPAPEARYPSVSAFCSSCHEAAPASKGAHSSHPVLVPYPEKGDGLVPAASLDPRVRLDRGKITCLTCHSGASGKAYLTLAGQGSPLCTACHRK